jgi:hypothetical protein
MNGAPIGNNPVVGELGMRNYGSRSTGIRRRRAMSVIDFFEYLASSEDTTDLAHQLADVWVAHQIVDSYEPAA